MAVQTIPVAAVPMSFETQLALARLSEVNEYDGRAMTGPELDHVERLTDELDRKMEERFLFGAALGRAAA